MEHTDCRLIKCPYCGSTSLTANYDEENASGGDWKLFLFGWIGFVIEVFRRSRRTNTFWVCNNCGASFIDIE